MPGTAIRRDVGAAVARQRCLGSRLILDRPDGIRKIGVPDQDEVVDHASWRGVAKLQIGLDQECCVGCLLAGRKRAGDYIIMPQANRGQGQQP